MAEARSMRRCLSRAFPVGLSSFEDIQEQKALEIIQETAQGDTPQAPENPLATKIAEANSIAELEALKPEITKSKSNDMVKAYAARQKELQNAPKVEVGPDYLKEAKEKIQTGTMKPAELAGANIAEQVPFAGLTQEELAIQDEKYDINAEALDDEKARIKELKEELDEEV